MAGYSIATEDIYIARGVCAHRKGDLVPNDNVKRHGWEAKVKPVRESRARDAAKEG